MRKATSAGTLDFLYDSDGHKIAEVDPTGTFLRGEFFAAGRHFAVFAPDPGPTGATFFMHADWLGTERARTNMTGTACETIGGLPFGDGQTINDSCGDSAGDVSPLHFTGKERDAETGLDYFGARYFSAAQGRFTSPDEFTGGGLFDPLTGRRAETIGPLPYADITDPQTLNKYAYVLNNPLRYIDPDGHDIAIIENGPTEGNPIGHTAIAVTGNGVFSFGTNTELGSSLTGYVDREAARRNTTIYIIKTTPEQDAAAVQEALRQDSNGGIGICSDNCTSRSNVILDAAGIPKAPPTVNPAGPYSAPAPTNIPGSAGTRARQVPSGQVSTAKVPKGSTAIPRTLRQFDPPKKHPNPHLPKKENKDKQEGGSSS